MRSKSDGLMWLLLLTALVISEVANAWTFKGILHNLDKLALKNKTQKNSVDIGAETFLNDPSFTGNKTIQNFSSAKKILKKFDYLGVKEDIYCGCEFYDGKIPIDAKCGLKPRKNQNRAYRIEFEHILPFENQVGHTEAWRSGVARCDGAKGRKCASEVFGHMEGDLWNLQPSGGEMNGDRSNYTYSMVQGSRTQYGKCNFIVEDHKAEPRDEVKAMVAFTYMYMEKSYAGYLKTHYISDKNEKLFKAWSKMPLKKYQCEWARRVVEVQKNRNEFLLDACRRQGV